MWFELEHLDELDIDEDEGLTWLDHFPFVWEVTRERTSNVLDLHFIVENE